MADENMSSSSVDAILLFDALIDIFEDCRFDNSLLSAFEASSAIAFETISLNFESSN